MLQGVLGQTNCCDSASDRLYHIICPFLHFANSYTLKADNRDPGECFLLDCNSALRLKFKGEVRG